MSSFATTKNWVMRGSSLGPALLRAAWQHLREITRHHGVWGFGVRLLRNMNLRAKATVALTCLALPLLAFLYFNAVTSVREFESAGRATQGLREYAQLSLLERSMFDALGAVAREEGALLPHGAVVRALQDERGAFEALSAEVKRAASEQARIARAFSVLTERRQQMLSLMRVGEAPPAEAMRAYLREMAPLRTELMTAWAPYVGRTLGGTSLRAGAGELASRMLSAVHRMGVEGMRLYAPGERRKRAQSNMGVAAELRLLADMAQPQFEHAAMQGLLEAARVEDRFVAIWRLLSATQRINQVAAEIAPDADLAAAAGMTLSEYSDLSAEAVRASAALEEMGIARLAALVGQERSQLKSQLIREAVVVTLGVLLAAYLLICIYKVVGGGLNALGMHLARLAKGQFGIKPRALGRDEVGRALAALGSTAAHMSKLLEAVTQGVSAVSHASREVSVGNAGLSTRTRDMHAAIADVARRTQSFTSAMDSCAHEVAQASEYVRTMRGNAQRSRQAVIGLRARMRSLQGKSREINQVVALVEAVSHQTKLLSLNASVEAARAGAAGKGFAVVAQEVRALAQRSEEAARRIHAIVTSSVEEIEDGNVLADRANDAVQETDAKINAVNDLVSNVVQLTQSGMSDSQEVLSIARNLEAAANGNAQVVDQLSDASAALRVQGDSLKRSVQHFVLR